MEESIKYNAELVIKQMKDLLGVILSYDEESVAWLDNYIVGIRGDLSQEVMDNLVSVLGSFFGECIRRRYGGEWRQTEGQWAIVFDDRNAIFPFTKMANTSRARANPSWACTKLFRLSSGSVER